MIKTLRQKKSTISAYLKFFDNWFNLFSFSFLFYVVLIFVATILESVSIVSLIPLIQSIQSVTPGTDQLNSINLYLLRINESLGFGTIELIILFFSLQILKILITHFGEILLFTKTHNIHQNIQRKIIDSVVNMYWISFLGISTGKINNLVSQDTPRAASIFKMICQCINYSIFISIYFIGMIVISLKATLVIVIFSIISFTVLRLFAKTTYTSGKKITESSKRYLDLITDIFLQMKPLKTSNFTNFLQEKINTEIVNHRNAYLLKNYMATGISFFQNFTLIILFGSILIFFFHKGNTYVAESLVFIVIAYRLSQQMMIFQQCINNAIANIPSISQIQKFLSHSNTTKESIHFGKLKSNFKKILFKDVHCKMGKNLILKNINLEIKKNTFIAFVGKSGVGKSTLIDMIMGLVIPSSGNIFINNDNLNKHDINHWRSQIAYVPQEHFLLKDSIRNNIILNLRYNNHKFNKIMDLLDLKDIDPDFEVSEKGSTLSVGQKQRLSIARALYSDRKIIILDEPTSNLNSLLESKILNFFKRERESKTIIMVTHNKSVIKYAKVVYKVMGNGIRKI
jgi:ABC-type multidrug transport system fused ATPase/permease subunit